MDFFFKKKDETKKVVFPFVGNRTDPISLY